MRSKISKLLIPALITGMMSAGVAFAQANTNVDLAVSDVTAAPATLQTDLGPHTALIFTGVVENKGTETASTYYLRIGEFAPTAVKYYAYTEGNNPNFNSAAVAVEGTPALEAGTKYYFKAASIKYTPEKAWAYPVTLTQIDKNNKDIKEKNNKDNVTAVKIGRWAQVDLGLQTVRTDIKYAIDENGVEDTTTVEGMTVTGYVVNLGRTVISADEAKYGFKKQLVMTVGKEELDLTNIVWTLPTHETSTDLTGEYLLPGEKAFFSLSDASDLSLSKGLKGGKVQLASGTKAVITVSSYDLATKKWTSPQDNDIKNNILPWAKIAGSDSYAGKAKAKTLEGGAKAKKGFQNFKKNLKSDTETPDEETPADETPAE